MDLVSVVVTYGAGAARVPGSVGPWANPSDGPRVAAARSPGYACAPAHPACALLLSLPLPLPSRFLRAIVSLLAGELRQGLAGSGFLPLPRDYARLDAAVHHLWSARPGAGFGWSTQPGLQVVDFRGFVFRVPKTLPLPV